MYIAGHYKQCQYDSCTQILDICEGFPGS